MKDGIAANVATRPDIGGLYDLGRGINKLELGTSTKLSTSRVGDSLSGNQPIEYQDGTQALAFHCGSKVSYELLRSDLSVEAIFHDAQSFHQSRNATAEASVKYGAFSGGFSATFGQDIQTLESHSAAMRTEALTLWRLTIPANWDSTTDEFRAKLHALPPQFNQQSRSAYFNFIYEFGTDIVTEVLVGGSLTYALLIDKSRFSSTEKITAAANAEYASFVKANATAEQTREVQRNSDSLTRSLSTVGGNYNFQFSGDTPGRYREGQVAWRATVAAAPRVVSVRTEPISKFIQDEERRVSLAAAYEYYTQKELLMAAEWTGSAIVIGDDPSQQGRPDSSREPALRVVVVDEETKVVSDKSFHTPSAQASNAEFDDYWRGMAGTLNAIDPVHRKILLTTKYWPRDKRYAPSVEMVEALQKHGASRSTLAKWKKLTAKMAPCAIAGLTYALAGNRLSTAGIDGLAVGFARRDETPNASVTIHARFSHDQMGWLKLTEMKNTTQTSTTPLMRISNSQSKQVMALDPGNPEQIIMQEAELNDIGQLWYFHQLAKRDNYPEINTPSVLVNYETGRILQGRRDQGASRLSVLEPVQQDDVIWDHRNGNVNCNLLMVYYFPDALNLTQVGNRVAVRPWLQEYMRWNLTPVK